MQRSDLPGRKSMLLLLKISTRRSAEPAGRLRRRNFRGVVIQVGLRVEAEASLLALGGACTPGR